MTTKLPAKIDQVLYSWIERRLSPEPYHTDMRTDKKVLRIAHAALLEGVVTETAALHMRVAESCNLPPLRQRKYREFAAYPIVPEVPLDRAAINEYNRQYDGLTTLVGLVATARALQHPPVRRFIVGGTLLGALPGAAPEDEKMMRVSRGWTGEKLQNNTRVMPILWQQAVGKVGAMRQHRYVVPRTALGVVHGYEQGWQESGKSPSMQLQIDAIDQIRDYVAEKVLARANRMQADIAAMEPLVAHNYLAQLSLSGLSTAMNLYMPRIIQP